MSYKENKIDLTCVWSSLWYYADDFLCMLNENTLDQSDIENLIILYKNTSVSSDCHNVECEDYGPDSWNDILNKIEEEIYNRSKMKMTVKEYLIHKGYKIS